MRTTAWLCVSLSLTVLVLSGCTSRREAQPKAGNGPEATAPASTAPRTNDVAAIRANLDKLSPEDRKLAEEQGFCPVETKNPLGSMGVPCKIELKEKSVFLCCDGCETRARAHAERTLMRVAQFKEKKPTQTAP